ncbi:MAG: alcohol dehydrogenase [Lasallia pustulata]|uniref:Alcohol dehydrogenase n=1 Tax=Lasallia pustulata TaxID=136370 RepID=A0A1W5DCF8_9LECA|nr:MAG: alcohol dehydrogenase [Lasallia pustulata]SLM40612.1 short chain dehydrogenase reductase [Lasallia pustulata]
MPYPLKGRKVLITGGSRGLGAVVAEKFAAEGCSLAINYVSNADRAKQTADKLAKDYNAKVVLIQGDVGVLADCERTVKESISGLGGLDIIVSNAGWTKLSDFGDLNALSEAEWDKCWAVNVKGNMHLLREAIPTFNANEEGGVFLMSSSIAGVAPTGSTMAYSVSKAAGLHLMKCLASTQGPKIRINAVLPGLLLTEWGSRFGPERIKATEDRAVLKRATDLEDTADAFVAAAKNTSMTGQSIQIDCGLVIR